MFTVSLEKDIDAITRNQQLNKIHKVIEQNVPYDMSNLGDRSKNQNNSKNVLDQIAHFAYAQSMKAKQKR